MDDDDHSKIGVWSGIDGQAARRPMTSTPLSGYQLLL